MANQRFTDLPAGTPVGTDVFAAVDMAADVSKQYTRSQQVNFSLNAMGLTAYEAALVATTGALTVAYDNGASGVGATITNAGAQAALSIDGVTMAVSDRVLVKDQATAAENGIYTVTDIGSGATNWVMTRATDYDQAAEVVQYGVLLSDTGATNAGLLWQETGPGPFTMGTTDIVFTQFVVNSAAGAAGGSDTEIQYNNAGALDGDSGFTTDGAGALSAVSLSLTSPLPVTSGGTALSSTTANQLLYSSATSTIAGLATANNGLLVTNGSGVPSIGNTISGPYSITLGNITGNQTFYNISGRAISANNTNLGQVIDISGSGINSTLTALQCNATQQDAGVGGYTGIDVNTTTARLSGASGTSYYGGHFKLNTPASASTASNMTYYGLRSRVTNATTGETSITYGLSSVASGPSTVYGVFASATGGSTNYGVYSAAGNNVFVGNTSVTGTLTPSQTNGIVGTTTNNNANAGSVGQYVEGEVLYASAVSLTTATSANVTSISLTAGDWQVYGVVNFAPTSTTTWTRTYAWLSVSSASIPGAGSYNEIAANEFNGTTTGANGVWRTAVIPTRRFSLSGTTTIYLSAQATFGVSTMDAFGKVVARRVR